MSSLEQPIEADDSNVLYDVMRKEVRQAVEEIRTQLEKVSFDMCCTCSFKLLIYIRL